MTQEHALNLQPGDEIEWMENEWWKVLSISIRADNPAPVFIELRSIVDGKFISSLQCGPTLLFNCRRACGH